jgi:DDE superfamily endonuclease
VWRRLRAVVPERTGILILDETSFPKSGPHSVGVARQYCGALGKVANCQVAVTAALWTRRRAWPMGALLYLPDEWTSDPRRRAAAQIPATVGFQEKWRLALTPVRRTRAAGVAGTPRLRIDRAQPPPRNRREDWPDQEPVSVRTLSNALPARAWRRVTWRNGTNPPWEADFVAVRVTPARLAPPTSRPGGLAAVRARSRPLRPSQTLLGRVAGVRVGQTARPPGAQPLGDRTALSGSQDRTWAQPLRRTHVSGLAASHGDQRSRLRLCPARADATAPGTTAHVSAGARLRSGDLCRPAVYQPASIHAVDEASRTPVSSTTDLTKVVLARCRCGRPV